MWNNLSMRQKSDLISLGVKNGITDLTTIKDIYNKYAEGGGLVREKNNHPIAYDDEGNLVDQVTGEKGTMVLPEVTITANNPSNYRSSFDGSLDNYINTINSMTGGLINRFSPTQNIRALYDLYPLSKGEMSTNDYLNSLIEGNNGVVSDKFASEHPNLSIGINTGLDTLVGGTLLKSNPVSPVNNRNKLSLSSNSLDVLDQAIVTGAHTSIGAAGSSYLADKVIDPEKEFIASIALAPVLGLGSLGAHKLASKGLYKVSKPIGRTFNDITYHPVATTTYLSKGDYNINRGKTLRKYVNAASKGSTETYKDFLETYNFIPLNKSKINFTKYDDIYKKKHPGSSGVYISRTNKIELPLFRNKKSNLPILQSNEYKGLVGHEATHASLNDVNNSSNPLTIYNYDTKYYVPSEVFNSVSKEASDILKTPRSKGQYGEWIKSPEEVLAEFNNYKRQNNIKGDYSSLSKDHKNKLVKKLSKRFKLNNKETDKVLKGLDRYLSYIDDSYTNFFNSFLE